MFPQMVTQEFKRWVNPRVICQAIVFLVVELTYGKRASILAAIEGKAGGRRQRGEGNSQDRG
jgi:hypothetical protein